jgi:protein-disulfide isomerase/uncharacterized membrane protein
MTKTTRSWTLPLLVALALAAAGISLMLTSYHLTQGKAPGAVFRLACDAEEGGCADVLASPWAVGPGGIPTATYGAVYFGTLALWYLVVGRPRGQGRYWHAIPLGLNLAGALLSAFLMSLMLTRLGAVCWWCTLSHLINFAMLFLAWRMWREIEGHDWPPARLGFAGVLLMIAWAVLCVQGLMVSSARQAAREAADYARTFYEDTDLQRYLQQRQASTALPIRPDDPVRGNPAAPHTAVVFSDFQCPACRGFAEFFDSQVLPAMGDRLRIVYKHFPLEPECNPLLPQVVHDQACEAADVAEAARSLGGSDAFWKMHDRLFATQDGLGQAPWARLATETGLDPARISELAASRAFRDRIREDADLGARLDIQSTPTVFLDGKKMEDWRRLDLWQALTN